MSDPTTVPATLFFETMNRLSRETDLARREVCERAKKLVKDRSFPALDALGKAVGDLQRAENCLSEAMQLMPAYDFKEAVKGLTAMHESAAAAADESSEGSAP